jgi:hypothetical protein
MNPKVAKVRGSVNVNNEDEGFIDPETIAEMSPEEEYEDLTNRLRELADKGLSKARIAVGLIKSSGQTYDDEIAADLPSMTFQVFCDKWLPQIGSGWPLTRKEGNKTTPIKDPKAKDVAYKLGALARPKNLVRMTSLIGDNLIIGTVNASKRIDLAWLSSLGLDADIEATIKAWNKKTENRARTCLCGVGRKDIQVSLRRESPGVFVATVIPHK